MTSSSISYGNVTANYVFIYFLDEVPDNTLIKLTNIDNIGSEASSNEIHSDKSDAYAFSKLAREMYLLQSENND
ncbi:unnamed protein product [Rotaria sp. Silwood1]|nr:unnamed protein product [Rotaria sp. Silwood1]